MPSFTTSTPARRPAHRGEHGRHVTPSLPVPALPHHPPARSEQERPATDLARYDVGFLLNPHSVAPTALPNAFVSPPPPFQGATTSRSPLSLHSFAGDDDTPFADAKQLPYSPQLPSNPYMLSNSVFSSTSPAAFAAAHLPQPSLTTALPGSQAALPLPRSLSLLSLPPAAHKQEPSLPSPASPSPLPPPSAPRTSPRAAKTINKAADKLTCGICARSFREASARNKHVRSVHQKIRDHACEMCGQRFAERSNLRKHVQARHKDDRPHACKQCPKRFHFTDGLARHIRNCHLELRPYVCGACGFRFKQRTHLQKHERGKMCAGKKEAKVEGDLDKNSGV